MSGQKIINGLQEAVEYARSGARDAVAHRPEIARLMDAAGEVLWLINEGTADCVALDQGARIVWRVSFRSQVAQLRACLQDAVAAKEGRLWNAPIIIHHVYPPIPLRAFDWCAYRDGRDEDGPFGFGPTKEAAVADLLELEEWQS